MIIFAADNKNMTLVLSFQHNDSPNNLSRKSMPDKIVYNSQIEYSIGSRCILLYNIGILISTRPQHPTTNTNKHVHRTDDTTYLARDRFHQYVTTL